MGFDCNAVCCVDGCSVRRTAVGDGMLIDVAADAGCRTGRLGDAALLWCCSPAHALAARACAAVGARRPTPPPPPARAGGARGHRPEASLSLVAARENVSSMRELRELLLAIVLRSRGLSASGQGGQVPDLLLRLLERLGGDDLEC